VDIGFTQKEVHVPDTGIVKIRKKV